MKHILFFISLFCIIRTDYTHAQNQPIDSVLPVRGLAIEAPKKDGLDLFLWFIEEELAPAHFNLLILRVDWNYDYTCHPELKDPDPLTEADVKKNCIFLQKTRNKTGTPDQFTGSSVVGKDDLRITPRVSGIG